MDDPKTLLSEEADEKALKESVRINCGELGDLYHGTSAKRASQIVATNTVKIGDEIGYLGYGFYCYYEDVNASKLYARDKFVSEKIAVLVIRADIGNKLFVDPDLYQILRRIALRLKRKYSGHIDHKIGLLIEDIIAGYIKSTLNMEIDTVGRTYVVGGKRPALMYCLRKEEKVKEIKQHWEEN